MPDQMQAIHRKLTDRERLQAVLMGDPTKITTKHCCRAAYYIREEAKKTDAGKVACALIRTGLLHVYLQMGADLRAVDLAKLAEHLEGPKGTVTQGALLQAVPIFMAQEGATR